MSAERVKAERRPVATELQTRTGVSGCYNTTDIYEHVDGELARDDSQMRKPQTSLNVATLEVLAAANGSNSSAQN